MTYYIGCPVACAFFSFEATYQQLSPRGETLFEELQQRVLQERPDEEHIRGCGLISIAFALEEVRLKVKLNRFDFPIDEELAHIATPIKGPEGLTSVIELVEKLNYELSAVSIEHRFLGRDFSSKQIEAAHLQDLMIALPVLLNSVEALKKGWFTMEDISRCGYDLSTVCRGLRTPYNRRLGYMRAFSERAHDR